MTPTLGAAVLWALAFSCSSGTTSFVDPASPTEPTASPSPALDDFHAQWCVTGRLIVRVSSDGAPIPGDEDKREQFEEAADQLDELVVDLAEAGFEDASDDVAELSEGMRDVADAMDVEVSSPGDLSKALDEIIKAQERVGDAIDPVVDSFGRC